MKPSHHAEPTPSAPARYAPSVPMSVYRELAAELRANKAVIDSLNSRNQQLTAQNQRLKQEIHNFVQATLNLGQFAGIARQTAPSEFPSPSTEPFPEQIAPDTLAKLVRAQGEARKAAASAESTDQLASPHVYTEAAANMPAANTVSRSIPQPRRVPSPIQKSPSGSTALLNSLANTPTNGSERIPSVKRSAAQPTASTASPKASRRQQASTRQKISQQSEIVPQAQVLPKLFTEQSGEYRSSALESKEDKEIGGIWLALSIILIVVTAFGAGFLIMKPLLNDR